MADQPAFNVLDSLAGGRFPNTASDTAVCSRKGCRADADWQLLWNNPRIHTPERRKAWASCSLHVGWFEDYLQTRGLWKETVTLRARDSPENAAGPEGE